MPALDITCPCGDRLEATHNRPARAEEIKRFVAVATGWQVDPPLCSLCQTTFPTSPERTPHDHPHA